ncbi:putative IQ motif, EF-hand binding, BAG domain-containing protein [Lupinus albus]|uniref:Putative IQ motif, EF-hand binding, BAG domain-containing protein n=1 Tax=Lupinus albus TaxID=3870 RepID=A0A6A4PU32_LUPAL|nr:putative IQ motif, EF-hand binding, BAG domain-containing protein [Lupinus albus]
MMHFNNNNSCFYRTPCIISSQPKKKVVSIPVHFVDSERTRNNSAIKIQKLVKGFLVRNSMRKIKCIRVELDMIEDKVCVEETMDLIMREHKERVKVSESIMNLLLKLDSVRVLDYYSCVRGYRKSVIQKAIALQELIDQILTAGPTHDQNQSTQDDVSARDFHFVKCEDDSEDDAYADRKKMEGLMDEDKENEEEDGDGVREEGVWTSMVEEVEENCLVKEEVDEGCENGIGKEENYENNKNKELLERMVEDNERMMDMMAQLFERNEMQIKLLNSLSQRVEQLERAYACDKLRKKKRRNVDAKHK